MNNKHLTPFGKWYHQHTRLEQRQIIDEFEASGIPRITVKSWMNRQVLPRPDALKTIGLITKQPLPVLFPY